MRLDPYQLHLAFGISKEKSELLTIVYNQNLSAEVKYPPEGYATFQISHFLHVALKVDVNLDIAKGLKDLAQCIQDEMNGVLVTSRINGSKSRPFDNLMLTITVAQLQNAFLRFMQLKDEMDHYVYNADNFQLLYVLYGNKQPITEAWLNGIELMRQACITRFGDSMFTADITLVYKVNGGLLLTYFTDILFGKLPGVVSYPILLGIISNDNALLYGSSSISSTAQGAKHPVVDGILNVFQYGVGHCYNVLFAVLKAKFYNALFPRIKGLGVLYHNKVPETGVTLLKYLNK